MINTAHVHFPVSVKSGSLGRNAKDNNNLIKYFLSLKEQGQGSSPGFKQGWKTDWNTDSDPILDSLLCDVYNWYINHIAPPTNYKDYPKIMHDSLELDVDANVWFQESLPGEECPIHDHGTISKNSWVYYLEVGHLPSPLTFPIINYNSYGDPKIVDQTHLPVYNDCIVMFPSMLPHLVKPAETTRYIIAGNINNIIYKEPK